MKWGPLPLSALTNLTFLLIVNQHFPTVDTNTVDTNYYYYYYYYYYGWKIHLCSHRALGRRCIQLTNSWQLFFRVLISEDHIAFPTPILIGCFEMAVCSYYVTKVFPSESTLYSYLNVKELLVRSRRHIWKLTDCNGTRTHNHLVCEGTLNHLAKLASCSCFKILGITLFLQCWTLFQYHGANYQLYLLSVLTKTWNKTTRNQPKRTKTIQNNPKLRNDPKF